MNAPLRQSERLGRLTTALGTDTLALLRFDGSEHLNELFEYRVEALATRDDLDFEALIGTHQPICPVHGGGPVTLPGQVHVRFNGIPLAVEGVHAFASARPAPI